jgi:hypothetical protein
VVLTSTTAAPSQTSSSDNSGNFTVESKATEIKVKNINNTGSTSSSQLKKQQKHPFKTNSGKPPKPSHSNTSPKTSPTIDADTDADGGDHRPRHRHVSERFGRLYDDSKNRMERNKQREVRQIILK